MRGGSLPRCSRDQLLGWPPVVRSGARDAIVASDVLCSCVFCCWCASVVCARLVSTISLSCDEGVKYPACCGTVLNTEACVAEPLVSRRCAIACTLCLSLQLVRCAWRYCLVRRWCLAVGRDCGITHRSFDGCRFCPMPARAADGAAQF